MKKLRILFNDYMESLTKRRESRKLEELRKEADRRVQLMEYLGKIYISLDGMPLIDTEDLSVSYNDALRRIRSSLVCWGK